MTFDHASIDSIIATCETYSVDLPADALKRDAEQVELVAALEWEMKAIRAETTPDPSVSSVKELHAALDLVERAQTRDAREQFCRAAWKRAMAERPTIWQPLVPTILDALRRPFDELAARLTADVTTCGPVAAQSVAEGHGEVHARIRDAASRLTVLRSMRARLLQADIPTPNVPDSIPALSDIAAAPDHDTFGKARRHTSSLAQDSTEWWVTLARMPGLRIEWHTPAEQVARYAKLPAKAEPALAAG